MRTRHFTFTRRLLPLLAIAVPVVAVAVLASRLGHLPQVRSFIASMQSIDGEWWAVPLFLVAYGLFALFLLPVGLLSALAALVWGWRIGGTIELVACTLSALPPFLLARGGLGQWME